MADIFHQFEVQAQPDRVFEVFTSPRGLNSWWTLESEGQPLTGTLYRLYFGEPYDWRAEVVHVIPGRELTWQTRTAMEDWLPTQFGFRLTPTAKGTSVWFFHCGWQHASDHFAITTYCWGQLLAGLKNYVEKGVVVPFPQRN